MFKDRTDQWKILPNIRPVKFKQSGLATYENYLAKSTEAEYLPILWSGNPVCENITNRNGFKCLLNDICEDVLKRHYI